jgi:hypothetical protein
MEMEPMEVGKMRDHELNEALEAHAAEDDELSVQNERLAKIQEYEEAALSRSDPFGAVLGMGNATLQRIFEHLGAAILEEMDSRPHTLEELREFEPGIRLMVKLRNCVETDLALQPPDAAQQAAFRHHMNGQRLDTKLAAGKRDLLPKRWTGHT